MTDSAKTLSNYITQYSTHIKVQTKMIIPCSTTIKWYKSPNEFISFLKVGKSLKLESNTMNHSVKSIFKAG